MKKTTKQCKHEWRERLNQIEFYCIYCLARPQIESSKPEIRKTTIDCNAAPWFPNDWSVEEHKKGGQLEFDADKVTLYLDPAQKSGVIVGNDLRRELEGKPVMNACVLDHLLANTNLIPESWKTDEQGRTRYTYFWGTIYRGSDGSLCVRCLCWQSGEWDWRCSWLGRRFGDQNPAAVSVS